MTEQHIILKIVLPYKILPLKIEVKLWERKGAFFKYLRIGHRISSCPQFVKCVRYGYKGSHYPIMCFNKDRTDNKLINEKKPVIVNTFTTKISKKNYRFLKDKVIKLSDCVQEDAHNLMEINVLLGTNVCAKIITPEMISVDKDLLEIRTTFKWILLGSRNRSTNLLVSIVCSSEIS